MNEKIFIIEDEKDMSDLLQDILTREGFEVQTFYSGITALNQIYRDKPDLILLDLMLPDLSGLQLCKKISENKNTEDVSIIILTARSDEFDILNGFDFGCSDYITKPFNEKILVARIKACLAHKHKKNCSDNCVCNEESVLEFKDLKIDPVRYKAFVKNKIIDFTPLEFKLFYFLAKNKDKVFKRNQIFEELYENDYARGDRSIDILINRIRAKLGEYASLVDTIYGVGYSFRIDKTLV